MTAPRQTPEFDIDLSTGNLQLISGSEEKVQKIRNRFALNRGEWYLDTRIGTPWFSTVLAKPTNLPLLKELVRKVILSVAGIADVRHIIAEHDPITRQSSVYWVATDDAGQEISNNDRPFIIEATL